MRKRRAANGAGEMNTFAMLMLAIIGLAAVPTAAVCDSVLSGLTGAVDDVLEGDDGLLGLGCSVARVLDDAAGSPGAYTVVNVFSNASGSIELFDTELTGGVVNFTMSFVADNGIDLSGLTATAQVFGEACAEVKADVNCTLIDTDTTIAGFCNLECGLLSTCSRGVLQCDLGALAQYSVGDQVQVSIANGDPTDALSLFKIMIQEAAEIDVDLFAIVDLLDGGCPDVLATVGTPEPCAPAEDDAPEGDWCAMVFVGAKPASDNKWLIGAISPVAGLPYIDPSVVSPPGGAMWTMAFKPKPLASIPNPSGTVVSAFVTRQPDAIGGTWTAQFGRIDAATGAFAFCDNFAAPAILPAGMTTAVPSCTINAFSHSPYYVGMRVTQTVVGSGAVPTIALASFTWTVGGVGYSSALPCSTPSPCTSDVTGFMMPSTADMAIPAALLDGGFFFQANASQPLAVSIPVPGCMSYVYETVANPNNFFELGFLSDADGVVIGLDLDVVFPGPDLFLALGMAFYNPDVPVRAQDVSVTMSVYDDSACSEHTVACEVPIPDMDMLCPADCTVAGGCNATGFLCDFDDRIEPFIVAGGAIIMRITNNNASVPIRIAYPVAYGVDVSGPERVNIFSGVAMFNGTTTGCDQPLPVFNATYDEGTSCSSSQSQSTSPSMSSSQSASHSGSRSASHSDSRSASRSRSSSNSRSASRSPSPSQSRSSSQSPSSSQSRSSSACPATTHWQYAIDDADTLTAVAVPACAPYAGYIDSALDAATTTVYHTIPADRQPFGVVPALPSGTAEFDMQIIVGVSNSTITTVDNPPNATLQIRYNIGQCNVDETAVVDCAFAGVFLGTDCYDIGQPLAQGYDLLCALPSIDFDEVLGAGSQIVLSVTDPFDPSGPEPGASVFLIGVRLVEGTLNILQAPYNVTVDGTCDVALAKDIDLAIPESCSQSRSHSRSQSHSASHSRSQSRSPSDSRSQSASESQSPSQSASQSTSFVPLSFNPVGFQRGTALSRECDGACPLQWKAESSSGRFEPFVGMTIDVVNDILPDLPAFATHIYSVRVDAIRDYTPEQLAAISSSITPPLDPLVMIDTSCDVWDRVFTMNDRGPGPGLDLASDCPVLNTTTTPFDALSPLSEPIVQWEVGGMGIEIAGGFGAPYNLGLLSIVFRNAYPGTAFHLGNVEIGFSNMGESKFAFATINASSCAPVALDSHVCPCDDRCDTVGTMSYYATPAVVSQPMGAGGGARAKVFEEDPGNALELFLDDDQRIFQYGAGALSMQDNHHIGRDIVEASGCGVHVHAKSCSGNLQIWLDPPNVTTSTDTKGTEGSNSFRCVVLASTPLDGETMVFPVSEDVKVTTGLVPLTTQYAAFLDIGVDQTRSFNLTFDRTYGFEITRPADGPESGILVRCDLAIPAFLSGGSSGAGFVPLFNDTLYCQANDTFVNTSLSVPGFPDIGGTEVLAFADPTAMVGLGMGVKTLNVMAAPQCPARTLCPADGWKINTPYRLVPDYHGLTYAFPEDPGLDGSPLPTARSVDATFKLTDPDILAAFVAANASLAPADVPLTLRFYFDGSGLVLDMATITEFSFVAAESACGLAACNSSKITSTTSILQILGEADETVSAASLKKTITDVDATACLSSALAAGYAIEDLIIRMSIAFDDPATPNTVADRLYFAGAFLQIGETPFEGEDIVGGRFLYRADRECTRMPFTFADFCDSVCPVAYYDPDVDLLRASAGVSGYLRNHPYGNAALNWKLTGDPTSTLIEDLLAFANTSAPSWSIPLTPADFRVQEDLARGTGFAAVHSNPFDTDLGGGTIYGASIHLVTFKPELLVDSLNAHGHSLAAPLQPGVFAERRGDQLRIYGSAVGTIIFLNTSLQVEAPKPFRFVFPSYYFFDVVYNMTDRDIANDDGDIVSLAMDVLTGSLVGDVPILCQTIADVPMGTMLDPFAGVGVGGGSGFAVGFTIPGNFVLDPMTGETLRMGDGVDELGLSMNFFPLSGAFPSISSIPAGISLADDAALVGYGGPFEGLLLSADMIFTCFYFTFYPCITDCPAGATHIASNHPAYSGHLMVNDAINATASDAVLFDQDAPAGAAYDAANKSLLYTGAFPGGVLRGGLAFGLPAGVPTRLLVSMVVDRDDSLALLSDAGLDLADLGFTTADVGLYFDTSDAPGTIRMYGITASVLFAWDDAAGRYVPLDLYLAIIGFPAPGADVFTFPTVRHAGGGDNDLLASATEEISVGSIEVLSFTTWASGTGGGGLESALADDMFLGIPRPLSFGADALSAMFPAGFQIGNTVNDTGFMGVPPTQDSAWANFHPGVSVASAEFMGGMLVQVDICRDVFMDEMVDPSFSQSASQSVSQSESDVRTESFSRSQSRSRSASRSQSSSNSVSHSSSRSSSLSSSPSLSRSRSRSQSSSPSESRSRSQSQSASPSLSRSHSRSRSASPSASRSQSQSPSQSRSRSESHSASPSHSRSRSQSASPSASRSRSQSQSPSQSRSASRSASPSASRSRSQSPSQSRSRSRSQSASQSTSRSRSQSPSQSRSRSRSQSASPSDSRSQSQSPSQSRSRSLSQSTSPSDSRSRSQSRSHSPSRSRSTSQSPSESRSQSWSRSSSKSRSQSRSQSGCAGTSVYMQPPPTASVDVKAVHVPAPGCPTNGYLTDGIAPGYDDFAALVTITAEGVFLGTDYSGAGAFAFNLSVASPFLDSVDATEVALTAAFRPAVCANDEVRVTCVDTGVVVNDTCTPGCMLPPDMRCGSRKYECDFGAQGVALLKVGAKVLLELENIMNFVPMHLLGVDGVTTVDGNCDIFLDDMALTGESCSESMSSSPSESRSRSRSPSYSQSHSRSWSRSRSNSASQSRSASHSNSHSASPSQSRSRSRSGSQSHSPSHSRSASQSPSQSRSASRSVSPSASRSRSASQSRSSSRSRSTSQSASPSLSRSRSRSPSRSRSRSRSQSQSPSRSRSQSQSPSDSRSRSNSPSDSRSASRSQSPSQSRSHSRSRSVSHSNSASHSPSRSRSHSHSHSASASPSDSRSHSRSRSRSRSRSTSQSASPSRSQSQSYSRSQSPSAIESQSQSRSQSASPSAVESQSQSRSASRSRSRTDSRSQSASSSPSRSRSQSRSASPSDSRSRSRSHSESVSSSRSVSQSQSRSASHSRSHSHSRSRSTSPSHSRSASRSRSTSASPSPSESQSQSQSPSRSHSRSRSRSHSASPSQSRSATSSQSRSASRSASASPSHSASRSRSRSRSGSRSQSPSVSRSRSASASPSRSHSQSPSESHSASPSRSRSHSASHSRSHSQSPSTSRSRSRTVSPSQSPSASRSRSQSPSGSRSQSASPSFSRSASRSASAGGTCSTNQTVQLELFPCEQFVPGSLPIIPWSTSPSVGSVIVGGAQPRIVFKHTFAANETEGGTVEGVRIDMTFNETDTDTIMDVIDQIVDKDVLRIYNDCDRVANVLSGVPFPIEMLMHEGYGVFRVRLPFDLSPWTGSIVAGTRIEWVVDFNTTEAIGLLLNQWRVLYETADDLIFDVPKCAGQLPDM